MPEPARLSLPVVATGVSSDTARCEPSPPHLHEFSRGAAAWDERLSRRNFLSLAGASLALAGVTGCSERPDEPIVPYVDLPEQVVAGEPQFFATTLTRNGYGRGVIVTSREGRPVKIEGNPDHPSSLGAADALMQAAVLDLYDPRRSNAVTHAGEPSTWGAFVEALTARRALHAATTGDGLVVLTGPFSSATMAVRLMSLLPTFPLATILAHDPLDRQAAFDAATGQPGRAGTGFNIVYDVAGCDIIAAFDSDFFTDQPGSLAYARQFADRRRVSGVRPAMNRLYAAEADFTVTGSRADHRLPARPGRVGVLLAALATQLGVGDRPLPPDLSAAEAAWLSALATDLAAARGRSAVLVGDAQPAAVHTIAHAVNRALGNVGRTVRLTHRVLTSQSSVDHSRDLIERLRADRVRTLLILADNPARTFPADLPLAAEVARLSRRTDSDGRPLAFTAHLGPYNNETAFACQWHVPAVHELETWSDARAHDGAHSIVQPLIAPLTSGRSPLEVLNVMFGEPALSAYETVRRTWKMEVKLDGETFEAWWADTLRRGVVAGGGATAANDADAPAIAVIPALPSAPSGGIEVALRPDPSIGSGSGFHNPWLQELPRPLTKIVWGNAALIGPATARRFDLQDDDVIRLDADGRSLEAPVVVQAGIAADAVVLHLGYGEHELFVGDAATLAANVPYGVDGYRLRTASSPGHANVTLTKTGRRTHLVRTHNHHALAADLSGDPSVKGSLTPQVIATPDTSDANLRLHNRKLIRTATLAEFFKTPDFATKMDEGDIKQLYPSWNYDTGPQWGMTIDLTACIGCNACITACQAENNTPSVGPDQVDKQREMHWLRVDSYVDEQTRVHHQPVPCMHCENAPCEYVCPVAATTHSVDGLNQMTYNRCVGTRYCSNNCPYKVRRFNFLNYTFYQPQQYKMQANPDVTVRTRGVMEKCTYCVQRINYADRKAEVAALNADDPAAVRRQMLGRLQTACQQTCPTQAITFGDLTDPAAKVRQTKHDPRNYGILTELSTKPRTTYLAAITNPNPSLEAGT